MSIYTKNGDSGETSILGGKRIPKDDPRIEASGKVDELSSVIGLVIAFSDDEELKKLLSEIQMTLFVIGSDLATASGDKISIPRLSPSKVNIIEAEIDRIEKELPKIDSFILPGGSKTASMLHLARTICRETERKVISLAKKEKLNEAIPVYLNRLSDLLFMLARWINRKKKVPETLWR
ncbi:cob(I)yrinic acid a,c-diamide adenosyltransferase [Candidatus Micrarchaeota archaeon]|nr:cob(I)yrinic acid a,c-diamide adenosyltransferase [Candidatus Micrarchaeota archaeon]